MMILSMGIIVFLPYSVTCQTHNFGVLEAKEQLCIVKDDPRLIIREKLLSGHSSGWLPNDCSRAVLKIRPLTSLARPLQKVSPAPSCMLEQELPKSIKSSVKVLPDMTPAVSTFQQLQVPPPCSSCNNLN